MAKLKTATGRELECDLFVLYPQAKRLYVRVLGINIVDATKIFADPTETVQLWCENDYVAHYTNIIAICPEAEAIRITLTEA